MGIRIEMPESDTEIVFNVAGKSVKQAAEEISTFAYLLKVMTELTDDYTDGWVWTFDDEEAACEMIKPLGEHIKHREWDDKLEHYFMSGSIITGYTVEGNLVEVSVSPDFMSFAKTNRPLEEYCRENISKFSEARKAKTGKRGSK